MAYTMSLRSLNTMDAPAARRYDRSWLAWAALVFLVPFQLYYNYVLNDFYHLGAPYPDGGIFAHLIWHNDWRFWPPHTYTNYSFYAVHLTLFLAALGMLSNLIPWHMVEFYALVVSAIYAGLGVAMFYAFRCILPPLKQWQTGLLALASIGYAFNDIVMDGLPLIHFEYAVPLGIFLALIFFMQRNWPACVIATLFALLQREDAGFHFTAILGLVTMVRLYEKRSLKAIKPEIIFTACVFGYGLLAWLWVFHLNHMYGRIDSTFQMIYTGTPPYAHLNAKLIGERLGFMFREHIYLWLGSLVTFIWAYRTRDPYLPLGFIANLPWWLFNITAANIGTGNMYSYYGFPFVLSLGWPILSLIVRHGFPLPAAAVKQAVWLQSILIVIGLLMWNSVDHRPEFGPYFGARWGSYQILEGAQNRQLVNEFTDKFDGGAADLGNVMADSGVQSLVKGSYHGKDVQQMTSSQPVDTLLYLNPYPDAVQQEIIDQVMKNQLMTHYCMPGTTICMFTRREPQHLGLFFFMMERNTPPYMKEKPHGK